MALRPGRDLVLPKREGHLTYIHNSLRLNVPRLTSAYRYLSIDKMMPTSPLLFSSALNLDIKDCSLGLSFLHTYT